MLEKRYQLKFYGVTTQTNSPRDRQLNFAQKLFFSGIYKMKCVHLSEVCVMKVKTLDSFSSHMLKKVL